MTVALQLAGDLNFLNLFDQDAVTGLHVVKNLNTSVITGFCSGWGYETERRYLCQCVYFRRIARLRSILICKVRQLFSTAWTRATDSPTLSNHRVRFGLVFVSFSKF